MKLGLRVYDLERRMEGLKLTAYKRRGDVWTIGYGHTKGVHEGLEISSATAEHLLRCDNRDVEDYLNIALRSVPLTQGQFDALGDFVFQFGASKFGQSTLHEKLLAHDFAGAAAEFPRWVHDSAHNVLSELVERRAVEQGWFVNG